MTLQPHKNYYCPNWVRVSMISVADFAMETSTKCCNFAVCLNDKNARWTNVYMADE